MYEFILNFQKINWSNLINSDKMGEQDCRVNVLMDPLRGGVVAGEKTNALDHDVTETITRDAVV